MSKFNYPMILAERPAVCDLVPPGRCQFDPTFRSVPLLDRVPCGSGGTSYLLRFGLPNEDMPLGLTTCACLLACAELSDATSGTTGTVVDVIRPYTPISANHQVGCFDLLVKDYGEYGWLSTYMCRDLPIGGTVKFKHIDFNVKIPAPFGQRKVGMIAGGTGITPMIQALHAILGNGPDEQRSATDDVVLLYGSRCADDVLGGDMLDAWAANHHGKFRRVDVLSHEPAGSEYAGERGFVDEDRIVRYMPPASLGDDVIILVCGPPGMYDAICGPRNESEVTGVLGKLGYTSRQVFKF
jgi:cytochrome-b5 reductase